MPYWPQSRNSTNPKCYFGGHFGFSIQMTPQYNLNPRNGFVALKLVGLEVLLYYSVSHWPQSRNSTNPIWLPDAILNYKKAFTENDRESLVLDYMHLQATFLKKSAFYNFFPFQANFLSNAPGLYIDKAHSKTFPMENNDFFILRANNMVADYLATQRVLSAIYIMGSAPRFSYPLPWVQCTLDQPV